MHCESSGVCLAIARHYNAGLDQEWAWFAHKGGDKLDMKKLMKVEEC